MPLSGRAKNGVLALLGTGALPMLAGCGFSAPSIAAQPPTTTPARYATQQTITLSEEDEAVITRAIENRYPSSADNYYMVKSISVEATGSPGSGLPFVANVDWAGFGPVTARYYTVRGLFDMGTHQVISLGPLVPRDPPGEAWN